MNTSRKYQAFSGALAALAVSISMTACGSTNVPDPGSVGQAVVPHVDELSSLVASVREAPIPVRGSDGLIHVVYEVEVLNASSRAATITKVEAVSATGQVLDTLEGEELVERIVPIPVSPLVTDDPSVLATLDGGRTLVLLMDGTYPSPEQVPDRFTHRLHSTLSPVDPASKLSDLYGSVTERTGDVTLGEGNPVTLAPPLAGDGWLVGNGCCAASPHRRAVLPVDGRLVPFERFAIDWIRVNPTLDPAVLPHPWMLPSISASADPTTNEAYLAYDQPLLAVADGTVVKVVDGRVEQTPQTDPHGLALDEFGGNYVVLDIGDGFYAFYAHVKPGTFEVEVGERVKQGQVIGHLGNSGNSTEPHLHFQVNREPTITAPTWPYEFTSFDGTGALDPEDRTVTGTPTSGPKAGALPLQWDVVTFPGADASVAR
jgi:hypothetical protein